MDLWDKFCAEACKLAGPQEDDGEPVSVWTWHVARLRFLLQVAHVPFTLDDLSPLEWKAVGWMSDEWDRCVNARERARVKKYARDEHGD